MGATAKEWWDVEREKSVKWLTWIILLEIKTRIRLCRKAFTVMNTLLIL